MPSFYPGGPDNILGGKDDRQIEALRDYVMSLGRTGAATAATASGASEDNRAKAVKR
jgi:hypothetical protein